MDRINTYKELDWDYYWSLPHPAHRDLAYLLNAPCLLTDCDEFSVVPSSQFLAWFNEAKDWILQDAIESPHKLLDFVNTPRQYKLGLYSEDLFLYFLEHQTQFKLLLHDQQVFQGKQCIGSMDFIIETPDGTVEHWEMAIKYFMQRCSSTNWIDFVGPSHVDSMERKLTKMVGRQLLLSDKPETHALLTELGIPIPTQKRVISVGRFQAPYDMDFVRPKGCDPLQPQAHWIRREVFTELFENTDTLWKIRPHPWWIAPYLTTDESELINTQTVLESPMEKDRFLMLSEMEKVPQGWQEKHRWVLVVDNWRDYGNITQ